MFDRLNPKFALGRGIRRTMRDFFFLKKLDRSHRYALTFFVEKISALFVSVLAPNAKFGLNTKILLAAACLTVGMSLKLVAEPRAVIDLTVTDEKTNKFMPGAKVTGTFRDESGKETKLAEKETDARGQYLDFVNVNGKFYMTVTALGYQSEKAEGEVKGTDVRVSRRIRSKIVLKRESVQKPEGKIIPPPSDILPPYAANSMTQEQILSETGWDEKGLHANLLNALLNQAGYLGNAHSKLKTAPLLTQESFLRGLLQAAKLYFSSEQYIKDYLDLRNNWYNLKENAEDENHPKSSKEMLKKRLNWFLEESDSVDFNAKTKELYGKIMFVSEEHERKSYIWKKCFRAGHYLTKIARDFVKEWLSSLEK